ncbi:MAG: hypothetical protein KDA86_14660 [Planctomycetaceae bacterium]|nr:hypothetical protein [Planctomycetaceae bacterium]
MSNDSPTLDIQRTSPAMNYPKWMLQAAQAGKGLGSLIWELSSLMFGPGKLQPQEYFMYELYDDERYTLEAKRTFVGDNAPTVPSPWPEIANDKPTLTALLKGLDLPIPETQAIVHKTRSFADAATLRNREDVGRFLRKDAAYPIFGKPFDGMCSLGTANISRYDAKQDSLVLSSGHLLPLESLIDQLESLGWRYLFQTLLRPHPSLLPIIGDNVSTVRMFVLSDREGCVLLRAAWKIPVGNNGADNFWRQGNVLAGIDVETGRIVMARRRTAEGTEVITRHPESEASFENMEFPEWQAMREVVLRAAANLPGCHFQGWDVALTDRGPVLVELEGDGGDPIMEQLCFNTGLLQGRYQAFIESADEIEKEKQAKKKAQRATSLRNNFAQLSLIGQSNRPATQSEIDPEEVRAELQQEGKEASHDEFDPAAETVIVGS